MIFNSVGLDFNLWVYEGKIMDGMKSYCVTTILNFYDITLDCFKFIFITNIVDAEFQQLRIEGKFPRNVSLSSVKSQTYTHGLSF